MDEQKDDFFNPDRLINSAFNPKGWVDTLSLRQLFDNKRDELNLSKNQALKVMNIEAKSFDSFMLGGSAKIDFLTISKLATFLDIPITSIIDKFILQVNETENKDLEKTKVRNFIVKNFDLEELKQIGFINSVNDFDEIENKILTFFGYNNVFEYNKEVDAATFSSGKIKSKKESLKFWVNMAFKSFERIPNPYPFDRQALIDLFPTIRGYSLNVEYGLMQVAKLLYRVGVTVTFIPKLYKNLHIRGATLCVNGKPCIAITNYKDFYSTLWFALIHECFHVLYDWEEISESESKCHLSTGVSSKIDEDAADDFAKKYLFSDEKMQLIKHSIDNFHLVSTFARNNNVHHGIVYGIYAYAYSTKDVSFFGKFKKYIPTCFEAIKHFDPSQYESFVPIPQIVKKTYNNIK